MQLVKRQKVSASMSDFDANLSVMGIFQIAEDAVTELMGDLKIDGLTAKREYNAVWVFAKTRIKFIKDIAWNTEYTVNCFISKISHISIDIDVAVKNGADELCAYARIQLCALDVETGRIRKVSTVGVDDSFVTVQPLTYLTFGKIVAEDLPAIDKVKVKFTSIDYVVHTNNKSYVRFILDTYTVKEMAQKPIREMEVAFVNQSFEGDELTICKKCCDNEDLFLIQNGEKVIVKSQVIRYDR